MKKLKIISCLVLIITILTSCQDYLNLPPKNVRGIVTLNDAKSVLGGYLQKYALVANTRVPIAGPTWTFIPEQICMFEAYSDNFDYQQTFPHVYLATISATNEMWYANMLLWNNYTTTKTIWDTYYGAIGFMNVMLKQVSDIVEKDENLANQMMGEMYTHRAFYLFKLLQYFAPYDKNEAGIPVYLDPGITVLSTPRKTHKEVYSTIINDLESALELLAVSSPKVGFNVWYNARYINNLMAQVYWFKAESAAKESSDYLKAKTYALEAVKDVDDFIPKTKDQLYSAIRGSLTNYPSYMNSSNIQGGIGPIYGHVFYYLGNYNPKAESIKVSAELFNLYSTSDIRYGAYFTPSGTLNKYWPDGEEVGLKRGLFLLFQPEEAYLILAEAHYRLNETNDCITVLNKFKSFRNAGSATGLTGVQLLNEIKNERRKEFFCHRDMRWLDLKRYGGVTISRTMNFFGKPYTVSVPPNNFRYALPIPLTEMAVNPEMTENPGWVPIVF
ncbi:hypothetical protein MASR2M69_10210 [Bacteroidota bacterium]